MSRSSLLRNLARLVGVAEHADREGLSSEGALAEECRRLAARPSRRAFLKTAGAVAAAGAIAQTGARSALALPKPKNAPRIAIVGGGLAGLGCADLLQQKGVISTLYEAGDRLGGRCWSLRDHFPGQVAERGGELIDTAHQTMRHYATRFDLALESYTKAPGEVSYHFFGQDFPEATVVDEVRVLTKRMQADLQASSGAPTFHAHTDADVALDNTDLGTYLATRGAGLPLACAVIEQAYVAEYGLAVAEQSSLNFLLFIGLNRRSKFAPFGSSDERFHVTGGNDGIAAGLAADFQGTIALGMRLEGLARNGAGEYLLSFAGHAAPILADTVVLTIPFPVLRGVSLDASLGLSADKRRAIAELDYGTNAKTMVGFDSRRWFDAYGSNGAAYSDLPNVQAVWQTNGAAGAPRGILTDYAGGARGLALGSVPVQSAVDAWLDDLDVVWPGVKATATRQGGAYLVHREHWPSNPRTLGAYTCYRPGQFTRIAGLEGEAAGRLKFAGEHADSFYSWQGYMEGACLSGLRAANEILVDLQKGAL